MNKKPSLAVAAAVLAVLAMGAVPATSAAPAAAATVLEYKMPANRPLTYVIKSEDSQVMEVMGQSMDTQSTSSSTFTFKSKGMKDKNLLLGVTVDDMTINVTSSAQGDMSPDMSSVKGKSFDMVVSPVGTGVDVSGAEAITFAIATESRSIASSFKTFFPELPGKPIKIGDTWPSSTTVEEKQSGMSVRADTQSVNTFEGLETVDGMECARISSQITGTITGSGNQMGQDLTLSGTTKGKTIWYFAVKEGLYIKATSDATSQMSIDVAAAGMTIPMTQTSKGEVKLTAK